MRAPWIVAAVIVALLATIFILRRRESPATRDEDQQVLDALRDSGADLSKPTETLFYLYFPAEASARRAADEFRPEGFEARVELSTDGKNWLCLLTTQMVPNLEKLRSLRRRFEALASAERGEYDGWEAAVTR